MSRSFSGGCLCGAIRYDCQAEPVMAGHCHCSVCRKLSGTGHCSMLAVPSDSVTFSGAPRYHQYTADSGNEVKRGFCCDCGSPIVAHNEKGMVGLTALCASSLDDPSVFQPSMVVYADRAVAWDAIDDKLPNFSGMPPVSE